MFVFSKIAQIFVFSKIIQMFVFGKIAQMFAHFLYIFIKMAQIYVFSKNDEDFKLPMLTLEMLFESGNKSREKIQSFEILPVLPP